MRRALRPHHRPGRQYDGILAEIALLFAISPHSHVAIRVEQMAEPMQVRPAATQRPPTRRDEV
jgi:hypothetical protein